MNITLHINGIDHELETPVHTTLLSALRGLGFHGVKFGDEHGLTGADTILLDGRPVNAGSLLAAQAEGHKVATIEALGEHPEQGWKKTDGLHPLQKAFVENGAIQCGYCTPAQSGKQGGGWGGINGVLNSVDFECDVHVNSLIHRR